MTDTIFIAALGVTQIVKHPKNPRHKAVADDELVESVRTAGVLEPLIVAPHERDDGKYTLIAGHRRLDAAKKAKRASVPVLVRADLITEGQQIEVMLVENLHRADLSAIEEAEGYQQLELLGYKPAQVAKAVGRDVKTVRSRMKLLQLAPSTRRKVHAGDLTLDDAAAVVEFADDPDATSRLEKAAKDGDLRFRVQRERQNREHEQIAAAEIARLVDAGAVEFEIPTGRTLTSTLHEAGARRLMPGESESDHAGHLAWVDVNHDQAWMEHRTIAAVCLDRAGHEQEVADATLRAQAEHDRRRAEAEARLAAAAAAQQVRVETITRTAEGLVVPPMLADLLRGLLPSLLDWFDGYDGSELYQQAMGLGESQRWTPGRGGADAAANLTDHLADLEAGSPAYLTRALVAVLLQACEPAGGTNPEVGLPYFDLLDRLGHPFSDVDRERRQSLLDDRDEHEAQPAAS